MTANILALSGIQGFELADPISSGLDVFHAVWSAKAVIGAASIYEDPSTVESTVTKIIAIDARICEGSFASMKIASDEIAGARLKAVCELPGEWPRLTYANVIKRQKGGV